MHPDRDWSPRPYSSQRTLNGLTLRIEKCGSEPAYDLTFRRDNLTSIEIGRSPNQASINEYKKVQNHGGKAMFRCPVVSRKHAKITFTPSGSAYVADLGSHHGTYILKGYGNLPTKVSTSDPVRLDDGDIVTFGKSVGRDDKMVPPVVAKVEFLHTSPTDGTFPFYYGATKHLKRKAVIPPTGLSPAGSIQKSPSSSSGRYGLKTDLDSASSSSDQGSSDVEDSPAKFSYAAPCYPSLDWKVVFSKPMTGAASEDDDEMHFDIPLSAEAAAETTAVAAEAANVTHDVDDSDSPIPGSFPQSQSQSLRPSSGSSSLYGAQPPEYYSPVYPDTPDFGGDMDLETPAPEDRLSPIPAKDQVDLKELKKSVDQLQTDLNGLDLLRGVVTANQRAGTSRYADLGDRMDRLETDTTDAVQKLSSTEIPEIRRRLEKVEAAAAEALPKGETQAKDLMILQDDITDVYAQIEEIKEMTEALKQERDDIEMTSNRELKDDIETAQKLTGDLETLQSKIAKQMRELLDLHRKFEEDFAGQRASIEDARKAALADIDAARSAAVARIVEETQMTLKRKRSEAIEESQESQSSQADATISSQTSVEEGSQRPRKRAKRIMSTAGAVTVGAVATWSALAFT